MNLKTLFTIFKQHPASRWIMEWHNVPLLYNFVKTHPVKRILDLGTGIGLSSAICALALQDKGETDYHIDSLEQYDKCVDLANKIIPQELKEHISIIKSEVKVWQTDKIPYHHFSIFETVPEGEYDLIVNDGPAPFLEGEYLVDLPNGTITKMLLEGKIKPGTYIVWDGRLKMLALLERYFADNFYLSRPMQKGDDMNIIKRKDNEVCFRDELLVDMKIQGYFNEKDNLPSN